MGRPKDFVIDEVLDRAAGVFWRAGYEATSIPELEAATGLGRGSLYNAFGDKERLFLAALDRYQTKFGGPPLAQLEHEDVGEGIRCMLLAIVERMTSPGVPPGCLMTNSAVACTGNATPIESAVSRNVANMELSLERAIERAIHTKQIPATADARQLARFYAAVALSLGVVHKACAGAAWLRDVVEVAMQTWPNDGL
ncbi:MAG TPA: TetR/AcrR family transcriptional regulator [Candidatus Baltobacteraceae bacterium]|nr:TetR/AcrR family transcriptional regulator [Candidatus Baltobacteraceae bacterium]